MNGDGKPKPEYAACWNGEICYCCCDENGVEKSEELNPPEEKEDLDGVPKAGVDDGVPNAEETKAYQVGVDEEVPNAGE